MRLPSIGWYRKRSQSDQKEVVFGEASRLASLRLEQCINDSTTADLAAKDVLNLHESAAIEDSPSS